ncbi:ArsR family regulatory protein [Halosimplex carlsbadense 2-9-1]|uniref:ArsR family regulatory protein n=1 Tax=Halosimplex carlsbadense 2-9-1 TaxID=797114 RepID=M0CLE2_9EURY|nr:winged helix-turn-helix domain-containing protein [Halosimplex carlsbadense]ELZ23453.1 ArsR family regulatory protein [Halosimplex carlsbadense 2-9-1]
MGRLLPFKSEPTRTPDEPRVLDLDDEATEEALSALSSDTARKILATLYEEPKTPPEIRDEVGTSLQNVHYHVERLEAAELIQPAGEGYSEKGTEMTIYAPASEALVLFAGQERDRSRLKTALTRLLGSVGLLAVASLAVRRLFGESGANLGDFGVSFGAGSQSGGDRGAGGGDGGGAGGGDGGDGGASGGDGADAGASGGGTGTEPGDDPVTSTTTEGGDIGIFGGEDTATDGGAATATPTPDPATATQGTPAPTEAPSATPTPAGTPSPTPAETMSATPTPAATPSPTAAPTPTATATSQPTPTATNLPSPTPTETGMESGTVTLDTATQVPAGTADGARQVAGSGDALLADPAVAFFLGGLFMILVVTAWWYVQG